MKKIYLKTKKKVLLFFLMVGMSLLCKATTYYVSNSGNDSNSGTSTALPWQTLDKVSSATFYPGDQILFQRGNTFYGSLSINQSGNSSASILYGAYGTGTNPVITGFTDVNTWTNLGNNIWESTNAVSTLPICNMVSIGGINTPMGKYPNEGTANMGYIFFQSHTSTSITSNSLSGTPDFTGAELFIRNDQYSFKRSKIVSQTGGTISCADSLNLTNDGMPFFIQNHISTLDQQNEWYYNPTTKKISIYSVSQPLNVQVATLDKLVIIANAVKYIVIDGINFSGANTNAIYRWPFGSPEERAQYFIIKNCNISFSGEDAIAARIDHLNIEDNNISNSNGNGVQINYSKYVVVRNSTISKTGIYKGMAPGWGAIAALKASSVINALFEYNKITNCGYDGIDYSYVGTDSVTIQYNYVDTFCTVLNDGGGIYGNRNAKILNNIILNGGLGMIKLWYYDPWAVGIYLDDNSFNNEVAGNTVSNSNRVGIYLHNSRRNNVHDNLSYNNATWQLYTNDDSHTGWNANNIIANNEFISKINNYQTVNYYYGNGADTTLGILHDNYYCRPANEGSEIHTTNQNNYTLTQWQTLTHNDINSHGSAQFITDENNMQFYYNETKAAKTITLTQPMINVKGTRYSGSITLQPFTSEVLMKDNNPTEITAFGLPGQVGNSVINTNTKTVVINMPYGSSLTNLIASFTLSPGATAKIGAVAQVSGTTANSYTSPVTYIITAQDGITVSNWTVTVTVNPNTQADFMTFTLPGQISSSIINPSAGTITITMPYGASLATLAPTFTLSAGAVARVGTAVQVSGDTWHNFAVPVSYTLTAQDGVTLKNWTVTVNVALNTQSDFTSFTLANQVGSSVINTNTKTIAINMPYGSSLANLIATFSLSPGATAKIGAATQVSGTTVNNFTSPVTYVVTAQDGITVSNWIVTVTINPNTQADFITFTLPGQIGGSVINSNSGTISITMPSGVSLTTLAPTFTASAGAVVNVGPNIQVSGNTWHNFAVPVLYTIIAQDGVTSKNWTVTVTVSGTMAAKSNKTSIDTLTHQEALEIKNYPNPFSEYTTFEFRLKKDSYVILEIVDLQGRIVKELTNQTYETGVHTLTWNGENQDGQTVSAGIYIWRYRTGNFASSNRVIFGKQ